MQMDIKDRIAKIMEDKQLSPSRFADEVGLNRPAVSHMLNGRNKPGLDALQHIINKFPDINGSWLITGKGSMYNDRTTGSTPSLFDENQLFTYAGKEKSEDGQEMALKYTENSRNISDNQSIIPVKSKAVKVKKIAIFFSDNTYEEFLPADKE
jgi:transcriptional regulator with XRE-family HTH domain